MESAISQVPLEGVSSTYLIIHLVPVNPAEIHKDDFLLMSFPNLPIL